MQYLLLSRFQSLNPVLVRDSNRELLVRFESPNRMVTVELDCHKPGPKGKLGLPAARTRLPAPRSALRAGAGLPSESDTRPVIGRPGPAWGVKRVPPSAGQLEPPDKKRQVPPPSSASPEACAPDAQTGPVGRGVIAPNAQTSGLRTSRTAPFSGWRAAASALTRPGARAPTPGMADAAAGSPRRCGRRGRRAFHHRLGQRGRIAVLRGRPGLRGVSGRAVLRHTQWAGRSPRLRPVQPRPWPAPRCCDSGRRVGPRPGRA